VSTRGRTNEALASRNQHLQWYDKVGTFTHRDFFSLSQSSREGCTLCTLVLRGFQARYKTGDLHETSIFLQGYRGYVPSPSDQRTQPIHLGAFALRSSSYKGMRTGELGKISLETLRTAVVGKD